MNRFARYLQILSEANHLGDGIEWLFYPGMLAESHCKWWGNFKRRHAAHEGIDICFYRARDGRIHHLEAGAAVPAWSDATILNICDDFLGRTLVVEPEKNQSGATRVLEIFSHLETGSTLTPGTRVKAGRIIARTSDTRAKRSSLLPHLHLSCIEVAPHIPVQDLNWSLFPLRERASIINPVFM
jgi:hypothetical protein